MSLKIFAMNIGVVGTIFVFGGEVAVTRGRNEQERFSQTYEKLSKSEKVWKINGNMKRRSDAAVVSDRGKTAGNLHYRNYIKSFQNVSNFVSYNFSATIHFLVKRMYY